LGGYLAGHAFFQGLDSSFIEVLTGCAANVRIDAGDHFFREGEPAHRFYLIRHGRVSVEFSNPSGEPVPVQTLGPGDELGWSWLYPPYRWRFDARALDLTRAVSMDARCIRGKLDDDPNLGYELMKRLAAVVHARLHAARLHILDAYGLASR
jgi:CRP-like cAMP-binding protein